ncbi:ribonuclease H-like domain-containing protein, partial [Mycena crocata]
MKIPDTPPIVNPGKRHLQEKLRESNESTAFLDVLLRQTLASKKSPEEQRAAFYGPVFDAGEMPPIKVYTDGSCLGNGGVHAQAGAGIYYGRGRKFNTSLRITGDQTNNCGELLAILHCLSTVPSDRRLTIYSDSEYCIRSIFYWAPRHAETGWKCANSDLLQDIVSWIKYRTAPVELCHVKAHAGNAHNEAADAAAKEGA